MDMLGQEGKERAWHQLYEQFVRPELDKRSDVAWSDINKVLIKLPQDSDPIVEFNNEIRFIYKVEDPVERSAGEMLGFHEIREIKEVLPPTVDGRPVAFVYAWRAGATIRFTFDFRPNSPDFEEENHKLAPALQYRLECELLELILMPVVDSIDRLLDIGLSAFPALIPYPLNKISKYIHDNEHIEALKLIKMHCDNTFLEQLVLKWYSYEMPRERRALYDQALKTHACGLYVVTINALMGEFEGIITEWLTKTLADGEVTDLGSYNKKFEKFKSIVEAATPLETIEHKVLQSITKFLISPDTLLQKFNIVEWNNPSINVNNPSRHIIQHGKHVPEYYTRINSIKMFLVIHSIYWCIYYYETYKRDIRQEQQ